MKLKLNPSKTLSRRYLLIEGNKEEIEKTILEYIGILGWAKASPMFVNPSPQGKTILAINTKSLTDIRASLELSNAKIKILKVSGTLNALNKL
jgi:RNase P/RNase MRP subunit POP5